MIKTLIDQVATLQAKAGIKRSPFIKPFMRPAVSHVVAKKRKGKE
jgi:hypothetical protein